MSDNLSYKHYLDRIANALEKISQLNSLSNNDAENDSPYMSFWNAVDHMLSKKKVRRKSWPKWQFMCGYVRASHE